ncbi:MAG: YitT family protein [Desulfuromonadales bacterium]
MSRPACDFTFSIPWNLMLITCGTLLYTVALKGIAAAHGFVPSGLFGVSVLVHQATDRLGPGIWYILLNIPMFGLGWVFKRPGASARPFSMAGAPTRTGASRCC